MRFVLNPELTMHVGNIIMFVQRLAKFILSLQETKDYSETVAGQITGLIQRQQPNVTKTM